MNDKSKQNEKNVIYDFINSKMSPFSYDLSQLWKNDKNKNTLQLPMCSSEDVSFILQTLKQPKELLISPLFHQKLNKNDLLTLFTTRRWVNDCVVNAYMAMLNYKHSMYHYPDKCFFHKTSLFEYITNEKLGKLSNNVINNSNNVATYPDKKNFFSYDIHIIPINWKNEHWSTCIVDTMNCIVYTLDSLHNEWRHQSICTSVTKYVKWEIRNKAKNTNTKSPIEATQEWTIEYPDDIDKDALPKQDIDTFDCGIFCMLFTEMIGSNQNIHLIEQQKITEINLRHVITKLLLTFTTNTISSCNVPSCSIKSRSFPTAPTFIFSLKCLRTRPFK